MHIRSFLWLLYLESTFTGSLHYGSYFSLIWNRDSLLRLTYAQHLVIIGDQTIHLPFEALLTPSSREPTPFRDSFSKVAGL